MAASLALVAALAVALPQQSANAAASPYGDPLAVSVVQTSQDLTQALTPLPSLHFAPAPPAAGTSLITVNDAVSYQAIRGFGASMTDSSAWLIERQLPPATGQQLLADLFGPAGLRLDFVRVPIAASDYTVSGVPYSYDDLPPGQLDPALAHFSIAHDQSYIPPALAAARAINHRIQFFASPWSPPAWMKHNDSLGNVRDLGTLRALAYGPWAQYVVRFIEAYDRAGVPITALSPQNEPGNPTAYPGLSIIPGSLEIWITHDLVPALIAAHLRVHLYAQDYGWGTPQFAFNEIHSIAARYLVGVAWHCYFGTPTIMSVLHSLAPKLDELVDECSPGISAIPTSEVAIASLNNWASAVALWNLALDPHGGPVEPPNTGCPGCYGLAKIDEQTQTMTLTSAFYDLGQLSEFIDPGAHRVQTNNFVTYVYTGRGINFVSPNLDDVAVVNPDGTRVLVVYNNGGAEIPFAVQWRGQFFSYSLAPGATVTFEWNR